MPEETPNQEYAFDLVQRGSISLNTILELFNLDPENLNESLSRARAPVPEYELVTTRF